MTVRHSGHCFATGELSPGGFVDASRTTSTTRPAKGRYDDRQYLRDMMKRLKLYSRVRLVTDRFIIEGMARGTIGYIIEDHEDNYEIEFSRPDGTTYAQIVVAPQDIEATDECEGEVRS